MAVPGIKERQLIIDTVEGYKANDCTIGEVMSTIDLYILNSTGMHIPFDIVALLKVLKLAENEEDIKKEAKNIIDKYRL